MSENNDDSSKVEKTEISNKADDFTNKDESKRITSEQVPREDSIEEPKVEETRISHENESNTGKSTPENISEKAGSEKSSKDDSSKSKISKSLKSTTETSVSKETTKKTEKCRKYRMACSDDFEEERIINFLRDKKISERLICRIVKNGLSDGHDELLRALGITDRELSEFEWKKRFDSNVCDLDLENSEADDDEESTMSPDSLYLKKHLGTILVRALKDIVKKRPRDPIDFLGNWLINYKVCEEREFRRKEFECELDELRKSQKTPETDVETETSRYVGKEELTYEDWNYGEYEEPDTQQ